jgi:sugar phosphate isomerase/epimerase
MSLLSMNEITTFRWSFEEDVENYLQAGYRSIGVWRQKLADYDPEHVIDRLSSSGLSVSNLLWAGGFTGSDGRTLEESIDDARDALRLAAGIQAGCLVVYPGGRNNHTFRHAGRLLRSALDELLPLAAAVEVPLAIEPMHAACATNWTFLTEPRSVFALVEEYSSPYLKLAYDTYHFPLGRRQRRQLAKFVPHIGIVYLGDRRMPPSVDQDRCPLGTGRLPLIEIVAALQDAGYDGPFDVKLIGPEIGVNDYWTLLEQSQATFAEMVQAARSASLA